MKEIHPHVKFSEFRRYEMFRTTRMRLLDHLNEKFEILLKMTISNQLMISTS